MLCALYLRGTWQIMHMPPGAPPPRHRPALPPTLFLPCPAPLTSLQPLEFFLSASTGCLLVVAVAALRIFLAWKYVGDRLLTAALEYEETGW